MSCHPQLPYRYCHSHSHCLSRSSLPNQPYYFSFFIFSLPYLFFSPRLPGCPLCSLLVPAELPSAPRLPGLSSPPRLPGFLLLHACRAFLPLRACRGAPYVWNNQPAALSKPVGRKDNFEDCLRSEAPSSAEIVHALRTTGELSACRAVPDVRGTP